MADEETEHGEGSPRPPATIIPDKFSSTFGGVESHEEFMGRIRKLKAPTDPHADDYGRVSQSQINRVMPGRGRSRKK